MDLFQHYTSALIENPVHFEKYSLIYSIKIELETGEKKFTDYREIFTDYREIFTNYREIFTDYVFWPQELKSVDIFRCLFSLQKNKHTVF